MDEHGDADGPIDPTIEKLMRENFGPSAEDPPQAAEDKLVRGLDASAKLSDPANDEATAVAWLHECDGYNWKDPLSETRKCFRCHKDAPTAGCAKCRVAGYCGRECQVADWKAGHKQECEAYARLGKCQVLNGPAERRATVERFLAQIRTTLCPFALGNGSGGSSKRKALPRGFVFVQVGCTLPTLALPAPRDCAGHRLPPDERGCLLHFVTLSEFDADIVATDPQLSAARDPLAHAIERHDDHKEVVVLIRSRCGFVAVLMQPLVPEWRVARQMGRDFEGMPELALTLDDDQK